GVVTTSPFTSTLSNGATGSWTISPAPADGSYYWDAQSADTAGNTSSWSTTRAVTFDLTAPTTTIDSGPAQPSTSANAGFTFHASEAATLECNLDGAGWGTICTSPASYTGLADGSHTLQIRGTDGVGNIGAPASYAWSIDTTVPSSPTPSGPADGALLNAIPQLGGSFTDPTSGDTGVVNVRVCTSPAAVGTACSGLARSGGSSTVVSGNTGTYTPAGLVDGTYDWQVQAQDTAGNKSGWTATRSFTVDVTPPDTSIGPTEPAAVSTSSSATFDFSATESSTFECSRDGSAWSACTSPKTYSGLLEASHTFQVRATDLAGNVDATPATYAWYVDTSVPAATLVSPSDGFTTNSFPQFKTTFTDPNGVDSGTVEFRICSAAATAGVACAPMVQDVVS